MDNIIEITIEITGSKLQSQKLQGQILPFACTVDKER